MEERQEKLHIRVLTIGTDRKLFEKGSAVQKRVAEYGELFDELHIVVFSLSSLRLKSQKIADNVFLYPTNTAFKLLYMTRAYKIAKEILRSGVGDTWVVSTQDPFETGLVGKWLKESCRIPLQVQVHGDITSQYFKEESYLNKIRLKIAEKVLPCADCVRVVSKRAQRSLVDAYNLKKEPLLLPIATDIQKINEAEVDTSLKEKFSFFEFIVVMSSRLEDVKNVELGIRSFKDIVAKNDKVLLLVVGDGTKKQELIDIVDSLNLGKNVIFEGWQENVVPYLKIADVFLNTSNHEGYCLSVIEAAAAKCPIITTDVGVVGEAVNEANAFVCETKDQKCITEMLYFIMTHDVADKTERAYSEVERKAIGHASYLRRYQNSFSNCLGK